MWFIEEEELLRALAEGIAEVGGERAYKTFSRLVDELKNRNALLAVEQAVSYTFDQSGRILMNHIGRRYARKRRLNLNTINLPDGKATVEVSHCPLWDISELEPAQSMLCSFCKGFMEGIANSIGIRELKEVGQVEGRCQFTFGGEEYGPYWLQSQVSGVGGNKQETSGL